jgi:hypothetical protein
MWELTDIQCYNYCHMLALQNKGFLITKRPESTLIECCYNNTYYNSYNLNTGSHGYKQKLMDYLNQDYQWYLHNKINVYRRKE